MSDVVVVGAGPAGLVVAAELRLHGVDVVVLERESRRPGWCRGFTLSARSLDLLARRGLAERFLAEGHRVGHAAFVALPVTADLVGAHTDHPWTLGIPQTRVEELLEEHAVAAGAELRRGHTLAGFEQDDDGVTVHVDGPDGRYAERAAYLVGCDGSRSTVRTLAGIAFPGTPATRFTLLGDVEQDDPDPLPFGITTGPPLPSADPARPLGDTAGPPHPSGDTASPPHPSGMTTSPSDPVGVVGGPSHPVGVPTGVSQSVGVAGGPPHPVGVTTGPPLPPADPARPLGDTAGLPRSVGGTADPARPVGVGGGAARAVGVGGGAAGQVFVIPRPGYVRIIVSDPEPTVPDRPATLERLTAAVAAVAGREVRLVRPRWVTRYGNAARLAERYAQGRVLLAGDAAHVHPPAGAIGVNLAIDDAMNLGWKLAAALRGHPVPLATYHDERHAAGARVLAATRAQLLLSTGDAALDPLRELLTAVFRRPDGSRALAEVLTGLDTYYPPNPPTPDGVTDGDGGGVGLLVLEVGVGTGEGVVSLVGVLARGRGVLVDLTGDGRYAGVAAGRVPVLVGRCAAQPGFVAALVRPDGHAAWLATSRRAGVDGLKSALTRWFGPAE